MDQRTTSRAIIKAEEKERNRLGAELHDNVNQILASARMYIGLERKNNHSEYLDKADEYLGEAIEEIRELCRRLTTSVIVNEGLRKSVSEISESMLLLKGIRLQININDTIIEKLSAEQQIMIYRIIQEQTNNILKYAETKTAVVSLQEKGNRAELIISDKGKGFDKTEQKLNGIGFANMLNRAVAFNGKMTVTSSPGKGCKVVIRIPLNEKSN